MGGVDVGFRGSCCFSVVIGKDGEGGSSQPENDEAVSSFVVDKLWDGLMTSLDDCLCDNWRLLSSMQLFRSEQNGWLDDDELDLQRLVSSNKNISGSVS